MHRYITDFYIRYNSQFFRKSSTQVELFLFEDDRYLKAIIKDNGTGMSDDVLKRVLDPYFTDGIKHKHRKGLGLPFLLQSINESGE